MTVCPDVSVSVSWSMGLYVNLLTASASFSSFSSLHPPLHPPTPTPPPSVPQCVWLVAQTLSIRIALQCSSEEKRAYISNLCRALLFSVRTQRSDSPACSNSRGNAGVTIQLPSNCYFIKRGRFLHLFHTYYWHFIDNVVIFSLIPLKLIVFYMIIYVLLCVVTSLQHEFENASFLLKFVTRNVEFSRTLRCHLGIFSMKDAEFQLWDFTIFDGLLIAQHMMGYLGVWATKAGRLICDELCR